MAAKARAVKIRKPYEDVLETRRPTVTMNTEPTMTKQSLAEELDVNRIIKRYQDTGHLQKASEFEGLYGEFGSLDLREAIEKVEKANELFMEVPSKIRAQFENDAGAWIDFVTNPDNIEQVRAWGMAPEPEPAPEPAPEPTPEPQPDPQATP